MGLFFYILTILKYIAIVVLIILAIFLMLMMLTLFVPIKYNFKINKNSQLKGSVEISWFLSIIRFLYSYENKKQLISLKIFNMQIIGGNKKKKNNNEVNLTEYNEEMEREIEEMRETEATEIKAEPAVNEKNIYNERSTTSEEIKLDSSPSKRKIKPKKTKKNKSLNKEKLSDKIKELYVKIKFINNYPDKEQIIKKIKHLIKKIYLSTKPKYIKIYGEIGFKEPDMTGKFLAFESVFIAFAGLKDVCIKGNFNEELFLIDGQITGKFNFMSIGWPMTTFILSKPIWKIVKIVIKRKGVL